MDNLSMLARCKKAPRRQTAKNDQFDSLEFDSIKAEELLKSFPLPRYFQVHFSHIHDNCEHAKHQVEELKQSVERVEEKLDRVLAALMKDQL